MRYFNSILVSSFICVAASAGQPDAPLTHPVPSIFESIANQPVTLPASADRETDEAHETDATDIVESSTIEPAASDEILDDAAATDESTVRPVVGPLPIVESDAVLEVASDAMTNTSTPTSTESSTETAATTEPTSTDDAAIGSVVTSDEAAAEMSAMSAATPVHEQQLLPPATVRPPATEQDRDAPNASAVFIPSDLQTWGRVGGALAIVIALLVMLRVVVSKFAGPLAGGRAPSGLLDVLARYPIGRGRAIVVLKVDRRVLVIHQTAETANTLTEFTDGDEVAALLRKIADANGDSSSRKFEAMLSQKKREGVLDGGRAAKGRKRFARDNSGNQAEGLIDIVDLTKQPRIGAVTS